MMSDNVLLKDLFNLLLWLKENSVGILGFIATGIKRLKNTCCINPVIASCRTKTLILCVGEIQVNPQI